MMLEHKGIDYRRIDLVPVLSKGILRAAGFKGTTVPALRLDGERIQGSGAIARALDAAVPERPLLPTDPDQRAVVEAAERWGDEVLQAMPRRVIWNVLSRDPRGRRSYLEGARLGLPVAVAAKTAAPLVYLSKRFNGANDEAVRRDLAELPALLDHADQLLADGVIGTDDLNVADFQIATEPAAADDPRRRPAGARGPLLRRLRDVAGPRLPGLRPRRAARGVEARAETRRCRLARGSLPLTEDVEVRRFFEQFEGLSYVERGSGRGGLRAGRLERAEALDALGVEAGEDRDERSAVWKRQLRIDLEQRLEHEAALLQRGMRQGQPRV